MALSKLAMKARDGMSLVELRGRRDATAVRLSKFASARMPVEVVQRAKDSLDDYDVRIARLVRESRRPAYRTAVARTR